jgi:hypothetical protein
MTPTDNIVPLPYELHTDRELEFMLERGKPLAHFSDAYPSEPDEQIVPELAFAPHVLDGKFVKREFVEQLSGPPPPDHLPAPRTPSSRSAREEILLAPKAMTDGAESSPATHASKFP